MTAALALAEDPKPARKGGRKKLYTWRFSVNGNEKIRRKVRRVQKIHHFATEADAVRFMLEHLVPDV